MFGMFLALLKQPDNISNTNYGFFTDVNKLYTSDFSFAKFKHHFSITYLAIYVAL